MTALRAVGQHLAFPVAPPARLGMIRALLGLFILYDVWGARASLPRLVRSGAEHWAPVGVMEWLALAPPRESVVEAGVYVTLALFVPWTLGLAFRVVGPAAAAALFTLWSYRLSWGMVYHNFHLPAFEVVIVGLMPAAAAFSLDSRIGGRWQRWVGWQPRGAEEWTGRTLQFLTMVTAITYLLAGIAKVRGEWGWAWANGQNLLDQVGYDALYKDLLSNGAGPLLPFLYAHPALLMPGAVLTLVVELGAPFTLLSPRLGRAWAFGIWGMHWGIVACMDIWFTYPLSFIPFLVFFPIERLLERWARRPSAG